MRGRDFNLLERATIGQRPAPVRSRKTAHSKPSFWATWFVVSACSWFLLIQIIPLPPKGTRLEMPALDAAFSAFGRMAPSRIVDPRAW